MTLRQSVLKTFYPVLMKAGKLLGLKAGIERNLENAEPITSFYSLTATANTGEEINFEEFRGKTVLIVNTASDCGYTAQLSDLKRLHELYSDKVTIIGFPSNDFKDQEKLSDAQIASFCIKIYGISFLLMKKSQIRKGEQQNPVFQWLSDKAKNGWNDKEPDWNFSKYLINKRGVLTNYFGPGVSPLSDDIIEAIVSN